MIALTSGLRVYLACGITVTRVLGASDLAIAMRYAIRHWPGLVVFLDDGRVEMDTNVVERAIRPNTLTRKTRYLPGPMVARNIGRWR